jgi:hypothetical protein
MDMRTMEGTVLHWNNGEYRAAKKVADPSRTLIGGNSAGLMLHLANLGWPKAIGFFVLVAAGPVESGLGDGAPDTGVWTFAVKATMRDLDLTFQPRRPKAGASFTAFRPRLTLSDGSAVVPTTFSCVAKVNGVRLRAVKGVGRWRWQIPKGATGKRVVVTATVAYNGERATFEPWSFRVA